MFLRGVPIFHITTSTGTKHFDKEDFRINELQCATTLCLSSLTQATSTGSSVDTMAGPAHRGCPTQNVSCTSCSVLYFAVFTVLAALYCGYCTVSYRAVAPMWRAKEPRPLGPPFACPWPPRGAHKQSTR